MCGIAGILYKYSESNQKLNWDEFLKELQNIVLARVDIENPPNEAVSALEEKVSSLKEYQAFSTIWNNTELASQLQKAADSILEFEKHSKECILNSKNPLPTNLVENWNSLGVRLRDIAWTISQDVLGNIGRVRLILPDFVKTASLDAWKITAVLNNMDRLEVRGRDSLGISVSLHFSSSQSFEDFCATITRAGLEEEFTKRLKCPTLENLSIRLDSHSLAAPSLMFIYKVSQEVGALGDNVAAIRRNMKADHILWHALGSKSVETNVWSHTRWASNGVINIANCHPVDEQTEPTSEETDRYWISGALNGDVDNFQALAQKVKLADGLSISPKITTDAKIIPVLVDYYYRRCHDLKQAFFKAVNEFEGSVAICLSSSLEPGRTYLALKGSGQSLFIGLCKQGYVFASEVYGLVEQTNRYIRLDGATEHIPGHPESAGQIFILNDKATELEGLEAFHLDGSPIELSEKNIRIAEITTRDINRGHFEHFLLKEIFDAPSSIEKTLQGKYFIENKFDGQAKVNLGPEVFPVELAEKFKNRQISRILLIGQGTAAVAGIAIASMMQRALKGSDIEVRAIKATELSGYSMEENSRKAQWL